jgi:hypothetical protein
MIEDSGVFLPSKQKGCMSSSLCDWRTDCNCKFTGKEMQKRNIGKTFGQNANDPRERSCQQEEAPGSDRRGGSWDKARGTQVSGVLEALLASVRSHGILIANDLGPPPPKIAEIANENRTAPPGVRAFPLLLGREELVIISTPAWEPAIVRTLSRPCRKILRLLMLGMTHHQAADELGIQPQTVANSTSALYQRDDGIADTLEQLTSKLCPALFAIKLW